MSIGSFDRDELLFILLEFQREIGQTVAGGSFLSWAKSVGFQLFFFLELGASCVDFASIAATIPRDRAVNEPEVSLLHVSDRAERARSSTQFGNSVPLVLLWLRQVPRER